MCVRATQKRHSSAPGPVRPGQIHENLEIIGAIMLHNLGNFPREWDDSIARGDKSAKFAGLFYYPLVFDFVALPA